MTVPFALSVHTFIKNVGADAGFASIIGLAVLVLLYFAQMRETATLRDRLDEATGRVVQLENRLAHLVRAQTAATAARPGQPAVAPRPVVPLRAMGSAVATLRTHPGNAVNASVQPRPVPVLPGPPAGVGAQALGSATKLIPTPVVAPPAAVPVHAAPVLPTAAPLPVAAPATVAGAVPAASAVAATTAAVEDTVLIPSPAAGDGNGHAAVVPAPALIGEPPTGAPSPDLDEAFPPPVAAGPPPRVHIRRGAPSGAPKRTAAPPRSQGPRRSSVVGRIGLALVGLGVVAVAIFALVKITGGATQKPPVKTVTRTHRNTRHHAAAGFNPSDVTVSVLNGTSINNLAADVSGAIDGHGYQHGPVTNAAVQTQATTIVGYLPGHAAEAAAIAKILKLPPSAVQPADQSAIQACAASPAGGSSTTSSSCPADVIVTVGADLEGAVAGTTT